MNMYLKNSARIKCDSCRSEPREVVSNDDEEDALYCGNCGFILSEKNVQTS